MTTTAFERWLRAYGDAWERGDPDAVVPLFSPNATYLERPFDVPMVGVDAIRQYWIDGAKNAQTTVRFTASVIAQVGRVGWA